MKKYLFVGLSAFMCLYFCLFSCIGSYALTTESGEYVGTIQEQWANNIYQNFQTVIQDSLKVAIPQNEAQQIWNDYVDHCYSIWNLEYDDLHQHYGHFRDYVGAQFEMEKNSDNTYNYNMSEDAYTFIQDSFNSYIEANPLTYKLATIPSYTRLNTGQFSNYTVYKSVQEIIKNCNGYAIIQAPNQWDGSNSRFALMVTIPKETFEINFYGTLTNNLFTSVQMEHNWSNVQQFYPSASNGIKIYRFYPNQAPVEYPNNGSNYWPNYNLVYNLASIRNGTSQGNIMTSLEKDEQVYVFGSINAIKNFSSSNPLPYYQMTNYDGVINPNGYAVPNTNNAYESIVNNVQNGWTAQEVIALVDRIMSNGTGSGNGSGNGGSDSSGLWSRIGDAIGNLIDGIINVLTTVIEHLSDALLSVIHLLTGYTDDNGVVHEGLFGKLLNLVNSGFNNFLASIFSWLPEEIVTLFTAVLVFGIFFGLLKMLRR